MGLLHRKNVSFFAILFLKLSTLPWKNNKKSSVEHHASDRELETMRIYALVWISIKPAHKFTQWDTHSHTHTSEYIQLILTLRWMLPNEMPTWCLRDAKELVSQTNQFEKQSDIITVAIFIHFESSQKIWNTELNWIVWSSHRCDEIKFYFSSSYIEENCEVPPILTFTVQSSTKCYLLDFVAAAPYFCASLE